MPQRNTIKEYVPHSYYHLYVRGVNKQAIFNEAADYSYLLRLLFRYLSGQRVINPAGTAYPSYSDDIELMAYCLMTNHIHLFVYQNKKPDAIKKFMSSLLTSYSKYFNAKYKRVGSLFESRYKAKKINDDSYLRHISRYIHMNPRQWRTYKHSSLRYFIEDEPPSWLKPARIIDCFKNSSEYMDFLTEYETQKQELDDLKHQLADS